MCGHYSPPRLGTRLLCLFPLSGAAWLAQSRAVFETGGGVVWLPGAVTHPVTCIVEAAPWRWRDSSQQILPWFLGPVQLLSDPAFNFSMLSALHFISFLQGSLLPSACSLVLIRVLCSPARSHLCFCLHFSSVGMAGVCGHPVLHIPPL